MMLVSFLSFVCALLLTFMCSVQQTSAAERGDELVVGLVGLPDPNHLSLLLESGVNAAMLSEKEVEPASRLPPYVKKIFQFDVRPRFIKDKTVNVENQLKVYKKQKDAFGFYLGDDLGCGSQKFINDLKQRMGITTGMVGVVRGLECYRDYDIFIYDYSLLAPSDPLSKVFQEQISKVDEVRRAGHKAYIFTQCHAQRWYQAIAEKNGVSKNAFLYPDGQAVRMLFYYALATGCDGSFLYNFKSLSGEYSRERVLALAQTIVETQPLRRLLGEARKVSFISLREGTFGAKIETPTADLYFLFSADPKSHYHPSAKERRLPLKLVFGEGRYRSVLVRAPWGETHEAGDEVGVSEQEPAVIIASKTTGIGDNLSISKPEQSRYLAILQERAGLLKQNIQKIGGTTPPDLDLRTGVGFERTSATLQAYISQLDQFKRTSWEHSIKALPEDGGKLNALYSEGKLNQKVRTSPFNYYFQ